MPYLWSHFRTAPMVAKMGQIEPSISAPPPEARRIFRLYSGTAPISGFPAHWPGRSAETGAGNAPPPGTMDGTQPPGATPEDFPGNSPGLQIGISREMPREISRATAAAAKEVGAGGVNGRFLPFCSFFLSEICVSYVGSAVLFVTLPTSVCNIQDDNPSASI